MHEGNELHLKQGNHFGNLGVNETVALMRNLSHMNLVRALQSYLLKIQFTITSPSKAMSPKSLS